MTCIAVVRQDKTVYMAGDRGASTEDSILSLKAPKVFKIGPYLFGLTLMLRAMVGGVQEWGGVIRIK